MASSLVDPHLTRRLSQVDAVLCDLDGCLISGDHVFADARDFFEEVHARLWIVSNNSSDTATSLSRRLSRLGMEVPAARIVLAGEETVRLLARERPAARVAVHAAPILRALAKDLGLAVVDEGADAVVLGRDPALHLDALAGLVASLQAGASLHVTNLDLTHPAADGTPVPETGALLAALCACLPALRFRSIGKPDPLLLDIALERAGAAPESAVFIGDNLVTDGAAAALAGMHFVHLVRPAFRHNGDARPHACSAAELEGAPC